MLQMKLSDTDGIDQSCSSIIGCIGFYIEPIKVCVTDGVDQSCSNTIVSCGF